MVFALSLLAAVLIVLVVRAGVVSLNFNNAAHVQSNPLFGTATGKIGFRILQFAVKFYF